MTDQSSVYATQTNVGSVGDLPAVDVPQDVMKAVLYGQQHALDVTPDSSALPVEQQTAIAVEQLTDALAREVATWSAGTLPVEQQSAVAVEDSTGTTVDPATEPTVSTVADRLQGDDATADGDALAGGGTNSYALAAPNPDRLVGLVERASTSYDVEVEWQDGSGTALLTETVATGVAGGNQTPIDLPARSPECDVEVVDAGGGSGAVTLTTRLR